jgi:N-acetylglucosaminyl-diphospho-decaprenol L-rhamnosyltransferase
VNRTSVISVCFNSSAVLESLLRTIPTTTSIILVDNGSCDLAIIQDLAKSYNALLISNPSNSGFGSACNQGASFCETEFLFFINPDSILRPSTIALLESAADTHSKASCFNPRIINRQGKDSFKRRSCLLKPEQIMPRGTPIQASEVPVLSGAALFVRKEAFDQIGGFDANIFLYHEDDDISIRLREQVGQAWIIPEAQVVHLSGHSSGRSATVTALKAWHMGRSLVYTTTKHHVNHAYRKALFSALRQLLSPATILSKRKFWKHRAFLQGVLSARKDQGAVSLQCPYTISRR